MSNGKRKNISTLWGALEGRMQPFGPWSGTRVATLQNGYCCQFGPFYTHGLEIYLMGRRISIHKSRDGCRDPALEVDGDFIWFWINWWEGEIHMRALIAEYNSLLNPVMILGQLLYLWHTAAFISLYYIFLKLRNYTYLLGCCVTWWLADNSDVCLSRAYKKYVEFPRISSHSIKLAIVPNRPGYTSEKSLAMACQNCPCWHRAPTPPIWHQWKQFSGVVGRHVGSILVLMACHLANANNILC